jgi:hypothetical protein
MTGNACVWPVCPRPESDESVPSWFERVSHEYTMSPTLLLGVIERESYRKTTVGGSSEADRLFDQAVADRLAVLGQLSECEISAFWPPPTDWELHDRRFCVYCPYCCLDDLAHHRTPYGRRCWQQSWCTVCQVHGTALVVRKQTHVYSNRSRWSHAALKSDREFLAANRYRDLKVPSKPAVRVVILGSLMEIEQAMAAAITGISPNAFQWGKLTSAEFLMILGDVTTWALTHFEPVRSWSVAEDFSPTEEQEGYGLIGRGQRMLPSDYRANQLTRSLRGIVNPKVRGAALWTAHALLTTCHTAASDRSSGNTPQDRQAALLGVSAPASRHWLAQRQTQWPPEYRRTRWIEVQELP